MLALVAFPGEVIGAGNEAEVGLGAAGGHFNEQHLQLQLVVRLFEDGI
jgi:hypothetical protein